MIIVKQYRPAFCDGYDNEQCEVETATEITGIPFVKSWSTDKMFHRFSVTTGIGQTCLVCEFDEGYKWYVVCIIEGATEEDLLTFYPKFKTKYRDPFKSTAPLHITVGEARTLLKHDELLTAENTRLSAALANALLKIEALETAASRATLMTF